MGGGAQRVALRRTNGGREEADAGTAGTGWTTA
jgi:hypothetical protein